MKMRYYISIPGEKTFIRFPKGNGSYLYGNLIFRTAALSEKLSLQNNDFSYYRGQLDFQILRLIVSWLEFYYLNLINFYSVLNFFLEKIQTSLEI